MTFTDLYCDAAAGSNLNAGAPIGGIYPVSNTGGAYTRNGGLTIANDDLFVAVAGTPFSACAVGDFVSIYNDGAAAPTPFIGRITAINGVGASLDISLTSIAGTRPATAANGKTATVGGAWKGPNGADAFPLGVTAMTNLTNTSDDRPFINLKNNSPYIITAAIVFAGHSNVLFGGYVVDPRDGGLATIDGNNAAIQLISSASSLSHVWLGYISFQNTTTNLLGVQWAGARTWLFRCVIKNIGGAGLQIASSSAIAIECDITNCNRAGNFNIGAVLIAAGGSQLRRAFIHDNANNGGSTVGVLMSTSGILSECVIAGNGNDGVRLNASIGRGTLFNCDLYNNGGDGANDNNSGSDFYAENCNIINNTGYGINVMNNSFILNCAFGSGTQANGLGDTTGNVYDMGTSITYPADITPYKNVANNDFSIVLPQATETGRGNFTQIAGGTTLGFPDIGAAQRQEEATGTQTQSLIYPLLAIPLTSSSKRGPMLIIK